MGWIKYRLWFGVTASLAWLVMLGGPGYAQSPVIEECAGECTQDQLNENVRRASSPRAQRQVLFKSIDALAPQRKGITDLYFLGFGGDAKQDVFWKEVRYAKALFDRRFDTEQRSLLLINNQKSLKKYPLASIENLRLSLNSLSQIIDVKEDIVFLFLTSHGSSNHLLEVDFPPLTLDHISPSVLKDLFDRSGINWKIIVISACYAGGFVADLKSPNTLIMTAARSDRPSFGCSNTADFTYFGEAYLRDALERENSFIDAFASAKRTIAAKERRRQLAPSFPQIEIGSDILPKLDEFQRRLRTLIRVAG